jgi:hypothetical protein
MRDDTSVCGLKLLVYEATSACGLKLLVLLVYLKLRVYHRADARYHKRVVCFYFLFFCLTLLYLLYLLLNCCFTYCFPFRRARRRHRCHGYLQPQVGRSDLKASYTSSLRPHTLVA